MSTERRAQIDATGLQHFPYEGQPRIVSLVPSITELVCELGLTSQLVGRTGFCIHPKVRLANVAKVGGTKNVDLEHVRRLHPTHVILNIDENNKETADALREFVPNLIVTHPQSPLDNVDLYRLIGGIFKRDTEAEGLVKQFINAYEHALAAHANCRRRRVLYLIWKNPWMTVSTDTYISRTLAIFGLDTVPEAASERYPKIDLEESAVDAEVILLSSEPYSFREKDVTELRKLPALAGKTVSLIDGEMTSWYGPRAIAGLAYLAKFYKELS